MKSVDTAALCHSLMKADSEEEVVALLMEAGYWKNPDVWRFYGDNENNFSSIGNQQSRPDAAFAEKLVNAVDARLMGECLAKGIDPEGEDAPQSTQQAVAWFFDSEVNVNSERAGNVREWPDTKRTQVARGITVCATGPSGRGSKPCFSIADIGEGQSPDTMPKTFLSLGDSNKLRIPFVQGKFNMGGTGVLRFCGQHNLQLIVSRRDPRIASIANDGIDCDKWASQSFGGKTLRRGVEAQSIRTWHP